MKGTKKKGRAYMKLYRFVGKNELVALLNGQTIVNNTDYSKQFDTTSKGFCFFQNNRAKKINVIAESALEYLSGIVDVYAIICIEVENARKARGFYSVGYKTEYNLTEYSKDVIVNAWLCKTHNFVNEFSGRTHTIFDGIGEKVI